MTSPSERVKSYRDRNRARGLCINDGNPVYKLVKNGYTQYYSRCKQCLIKHAWFQAEYRERLKFRKENDTRRING